MRLISTTTLRLELFASEPPLYAILSHTWGPDEVTFQDFGQPHARARRGWAKIAKTCALARAAGLTHAWVDTCCIDKSSSAELSEAINSMYAWYRDAAVAYVFLEDWGPAGAEGRVREGKEKGKEGEAEERARMEKERKKRESEALGRCRWFRRGWTLQELIAPRRMEFYDGKWALRGTKETLHEALAECSGVFGAVLRGERTLASCSVAARMKWAGGRETTRPEDVAYCLLGVFGVNMPMLYGEGERAAFVRLQEEIMAQVNDLTLFAWKADPADGQQFRGVLARGPSEFARTEGLYLRSMPMYTEEFAATNKGVRVTYGLGLDDTVLSLRCSAACADGLAHEAGIRLEKYAPGLYARAEPSGLAFSGRRFWRLGQAEQIYLSKDLSPSLSAELSRGLAAIGSFHFPDGFDLGDFRKTFVEPRALWDESKKRFLARGVYNFRGAICFEASNSMEASPVRTKFWLVCGKGVSDQKPWVMLTHAEPYPDVRLWLSAQFPVDYAQNLRDSSSLILSNPSRLGVRTVTAKVAYVKGSDRTGHNEIKLDIKD